MRLLLAVALLGSMSLVVSCATAKAVPVIGPDGEQWLSITCRHDQQNCYQLAGERCPAGYTMASESGRISGATTYSTAPGQSMTFVGYRGNMLIKCKGLPSTASTRPPLVPDEEVPRSTTYNTSLDAPPPARPIDDDIGEGPSTTDAGKSVDLGY